MSMATEKTRLVILFEHEIREAAKAVAEVVQLVRAAEDAEDSGEQIAQRMWEAVGLCRVALHGAEDDAVILALVKANAFGVPEET